MSGARRSTRISAKAVPSLDVAPDEPDTTDDWEHNDDGGSVGEDSEHDFPAAQTRKRKAGGARGPPRKRTKGKLSSVLNIMPNEVIGEICSYLQPADLLHLVQSSKIFAIFLLAQASAPIWRCTRLNVEGLPECPTDITEQQYACLIFGHYCQGCGKTGSQASIKTLAWQIRRRWCERCRKCAAGEGQDQQYCRVDSIDDTNKARDLVPKSSLRGAKRWQTYSIICKRSQFEALTLRLKELEDDQTALAAFQQSQTEVLKREQKDSDSIHSWILHRTGERYDELVAVRTERVADLKNHLQAHGYNRELLDSIHMWTWRSMPTMRQSKRLTDRIWAKQQTAILPYVETAVGKFHEELKEIAYSCAANAIRDECACRLPTADHLPSNGYPNSSRLSAAIKSLLDEWATGEAFDALLRARKDTSQTPNLPSEIHALISEYITECTQRVKDYFTNILQPQTDINSSLSHSETLDLAVVVFKNAGGSWGRLGIPYRTLHRYYEAVVYTNGEADVGRLEAMWSFDDVGSILMHKIIKLYGLDPATCTHDELDSIARYVVCEVCGDKAMHWESARRHWGLDHKGREIETSLWRCLDAAESATFDPFWTSSPNYQPFDRCRLCLRAQSYHTGAQILEHIISQHPDIVIDDASAAQYRERDRQWYHKDAMEWPPPAPDQK